MLKCGSITPQNKEGTLLQYRIRDKKILSKVIIPIFEIYFLRTTKVYSYDLFKKVLYSNCFHYSSSLKNLLNTKASANFEPFKDIPSKNWVIGFTEAEGSFFLTNKGKGRYVHSFGITQKLDKHILEYLQKLFHIECNIKFNKNKAWVLETTNSQCIEFIIDYFKDYLIGVKRIEYEIWARFYRKYKYNYAALQKVQSFMRKIRNYHKRK